jgi:hypothetical protein
MEAMGKKNVLTKWNTFVLITTMPTINTHTEKKIIKIFKKAA